MLRNAASAIAASSPTKVTTQRLCVGSLCWSSTVTPSTLAAARGELVDDVEPPALGEVGDALDERHAGPPVALPAGPRRDVLASVDAQVGAAAHDELAAGDDAVDEVHAEVVGQLVVGRGVEDHEVAALAGLDAADARPGGREPSRRPW